MLVTLCCIAVSGISADSGAVSASANPRAECYEKPMGDECRECAASRPHCHGTLIQHPGHHWQCTEPGCEHPEVLMHALMVDCAAIGCDEHWGEHRDADQDGRLAV